MISTEMQKVTGHVIHSSNVSHKRIRTPEDLASADLHTRFPAERILVKGALRYPIDLQPLVEKTLAYLKKTPLDDDSVAYSCEDGGPRKVAYEMTRLPGSSQMNIPIIELIPAERQMRATNTNRELQNIVRIGGNRNGTVYKDATVRSAVMNLALNLIDVYAQAYAKMADRLSAKAAIASFGN